MPYTPSTVPKHVPAAKAKQWAGAFNGAFEQCQAKGGDKCEEMAMRIANATLSESVERTMTTEVIFEQFDQSHLVEGTFNPDARTVKQVIIRAGRSKNGRYYGADVLAKAASLFENVGTFRNHPTLAELRAGKSRGTEEITGWITDVMMENDALVGVRHFARTQAGEDVFRLAQDVIEGRAPSNLFGGSINAVGKAAKGTAPDGKDALVVESIEAANSVDDVAFPAAGGTWERLVASDDTNIISQLLQHLSYEEFTEARPDYMEKAREQMKRARQTEEVRALKEQIAQLEADKAALEAQLQEASASEDDNREDELSELRAEKARIALNLTLEQALRDAKLPIKWEASIREQLKQANPDQWPTIMETFKKLSADVKKEPVKVQGAGREEAATTVTVTETFNPLPQGDENYGDWMARIERGL